jgi:hypothetical protein
MHRASALIAVHLLTFAAARVAPAQGDLPVPREAAVAAQAMVMRFVDSWNRADGAAYGENPGSPADAAGVLHTHLKHVMERRHGVWKVLAAQNTFVARP